MFKKVIVALLSLSALPSQASQANAGPKEAPRPAANKPELIDLLAGAQVIPLNPQQALTGLWTEGGSGCCRQLAFGPNWTEVGK